MKKILDLYCDGASRGNPGPAAYGFVILEGEDVVVEEGVRLGIATNNVAEYQGLICGLEKCRALKAEVLRVRTDSELMVRQLKGQYKVRSPHLLPLYQKAKALLGHFPKIELAHVPRELNKIADSLANKALDKKI